MPTTPTQRDRPAIGHCPIPNAQQRAQRATQHRALTKWIERKTKTSMSDATATREEAEGKQKINPDGADAGTVDFIPTASIHDDEAADEASDEAANEAADEAEAKVKMEAGLFPATRNSKQQGNIIQSKGRVKGKGMLLNAGSRTML